MPDTTNRKLCEPVTIGGYPAAMIVLPGRKPVALNETAAKRLRDEIDAAFPRFEDKSE